MKAVLAMCLLGLGQWRAEGSTLQLDPGSVLTVGFSVPGSGWPSTLGLELWGAAPAGSAVASIPGSSQQYYTGLLFQGSLESLDGSYSVPLFDADAWRLGLPTGDLVAESLYSGGAVVEAQAVVTNNLVDAIFGSGGQARFVIRNLGAGFTIGINGYSLANAIVEPMAPSGAQMAGRTQSLKVTSGTSPVPEPATWMLVAGAIPVLAFMRWRLGSRKPGKCDDAVEN